MKYYLISFPRSGQHLIVRFLEYYSKQTNKPFSYCEFYTHCQRTPCSDGKLFQKNHDFDLKLTINPEDKYLVLYRSNILEQLEAYFRFDNFRSAVAGPKYFISYQKHQKEKLFEFIRKEKDYYINFLDKWVLNNHPNLLRIDYDELLLDPCKFSEILKFFYNDENYDLVDKYQQVEKIEKKHYINLNLND